MKFESLSRGVKAYTLSGIIVIFVLVIIMATNATSPELVFDVNPFDNEQQLLDRIAYVTGQLEMPFKYKHDWCDSVSSDFNKCVGDHIEELKKEREEIRKKLSSLGSPYYQKCAYKEYC